MVFVDGKNLRLCDACEIGCEEVCTLSGHGDDVYTCCWTDDWIVSAGKDKAVMVWNADGDLMHRLVGHAWSVFGVASAATAAGPRIISAAGLW